ncbi:hypothetical protein DPMN_082778 [Dreissena polymorpha]|uniref:Uncharacterized protein n=1 Tax=Dreissena polymorpha TaxID=45954 RepID=A0A9D3YAM9_DREPO|nr:hypothetical protein DPMN_082778 [Dreissena polymorpha]
MLSVWFTDAPKRQCPNNRRRKQGQNMSTTIKPVELQKDVLGGIRFFSGSNMFPNMCASAHEIRIRGESQVERTVPKDGSYKYALRKMKKPVRSQPAYKIADAGRA